MSQFARCTNPACRCKTFDPKKCTYQPPPAEGAPSICPRCKGMVARCTKCGGARFAAALMRDHINRDHEIPDLPNC